MTLPLLRLFAVAIALTLPGAYPAGAAEPLSDWMEELGTAAEALDRGEDARAEVAAIRAAEALRSGQAHGSALLVRGVAARNLGLAGEAASALRAALPLLPDRLRPFALLHLAGALSSSGHPGLAAAAIAQAGGASALEPEPLALAESQALLAAGLAEPAARAAEPGAERGNPAFELALADALRALGAPRAESLYRRLFVERAGEAEGEAAARAVAGAATLPERLGRAERLVATARPAGALAELEATSGLSEGGPARALLLRAEALLQLGRPAEAEALGRELAARPDAGPDAPAAEWVLARAAARQGRLEEASLRYGRVAALRPTVAGLPPAQQADLADDAAFLEAWLWYEAGHFQEAARRLGRFVARHPTAKRTSDARWFEAWSLVRLAPDAAARQALASLAASERGALRAAALYWGGRIATSAAKAGALYEAAVREAPDGWYGLLASTRLAEMGRPAPPAPPLPAGAPVRPPGESRLAALLGLAGDLFGAGLRADALSLLAHASATSPSPKSAAAVAELAAFAGDAEVPFRIARDLLPPTRQSERWYYPDAYPHTLLPAAEALGVDPLLVLAVMRRESSFRADVRSGAAARGLLQLREETALRLAEVFGVAEADLSDPKANLLLGVAYLGLLGSRFSPGPLLLAAYNAGPARASSWVEGRPSRPLDEWVEEIPYRETRQYVRAVTADWARYRRLRALPPPPIDPSAPVRLSGPGVAF